jgi:hypothetical protein
MTKLTQELNDVTEVYAGKYHPDETPARSLVIAAVSNCGRNGAADLAACLTEFVIDTLGENFADFTPAPKEPGKCWPFSPTGHLGSHGRFL